MQIPFVVHVAGPRISGTFHLITAPDAITKAIAMEREGRVFITDPIGDTFVPTEFSDLIERSYRKLTLGPKDHLADIRLKLRLRDALETFTPEELCQLVAEIEERLSRQNGTEMN